MSVKDVLTRIGYTVARKVSEKSPTLLVVGGIGVGFAAAVIACKKTKKAEPIVEEAKDNLKVIDAAHKSGLTSTGDAYDNKQYAKDLLSQYSHTTVGLVKVYWPAIGLGALSVTMILAGHHIINKRYVAAVGAYRALSETFEDYRRRVKDKIGPEEERKVRYNLHDEVIHEADSENGVTSEETTTVGDRNSYINGTERWFHGDVYDDNGNLIEKGIPGFDSSLNGPQNNYNFLKVKETYFNQLLRAKGYVTLNDVYEELGFEPTVEGQLNVWTYDRNQEHQISFGLDDMLNPSVQNFRLGHEPEFLLTFNCNYIVGGDAKGRKKRANTSLTGKKIPFSEIFA